jgi:hypothetical protein
VNRTEDSEVFASEYDPKFLYRLGQRSEVVDPNPDVTQGCGAGIHVSHPTYWSLGDTLIQVAVHKDDVISWMEGKVRARAVTAVRVVE